MPKDVPTFRLEIKDERVVTIPAVCDAIDTEAVGDAFKHAGQEGYSIKSIAPIQRDYGNQRDPDVRTLGVKVVMGR